MVTPMVCRSFLRVDGLVIPMLSCRWPRSMLVLSEIAAQRGYTNITMGVPKDSRRTGEQAATKIQGGKVVGTYSPPFANINT